MLRRPFHCGGSAMHTFVTYALFVAGFPVLIKGADLLVAGASSLARRFRLSELVIGLTVVAFGTSMPELVVSMLAAIRGNTELAVGNILGSNIANILLILGVSSVVAPLAVSRNTTLREIPLSLLAATVLGFMVSDTLLNGDSQNAITHGEGLTLLAFGTIFIAYIVTVARSSRTQTDATVPEKRRVGISVLMLVIGILALIVGGKWIVDGAIHIAVRFGMSESLVGLTIVAIGTSLPELATSAVAAYRGSTDIAVGNVVGSNILNIFWILGLTASIRQLPFNGTLVDVSVVIGATILLFAGIFTGTKGTIDRRHGILFLASYLLYLAYLIWRG